MGIHETQTPLHWNYFLALEDDVVRLSRYIEFTQANFSAYSLELARILLATASEVDVVAKQLCARLDPACQAGNIAKYREVIHSAFPILADTLVLIPRFGLTLNPWEEWRNNANPYWWKAYNNVKHHRHTNFADASLKNALNSLAGLYVLLLFFYREESKSARLMPDPVLFQVGTPFTIDYRAFGGPGTFYLLAEDLTSHIVFNGPE